MFRERGGWGGRGECVCTPVQPSNLPHVVSPVGNRVNCGLPLLASVFCSYQISILPYQVVEEEKTAIFSTST